ADRGPLYILCNQALYYLCGKKSNSVSVAAAPTVSDEFLDVVLLSAPKQAIEEGEDGEGCLEDIWASSPPMPPPLPPMVKSVMRVPPNSLEIPGANSASNNIIKLETLVSMLRMRSSVVAAGGLRRERRRTTRCTREPSCRVYIALKKALHTVLQN